ncbi:cyclosome subunit-like protein, putative, partial [Bodo saltans]
MLTLATKNFRALDVIPTPPLVLEGRTSDGILIANEVIQSPDSLVWPTFHNGCAAGLRFLPLAGGRAASADDPQQGQAQPILSRHWVVYQTRGSHNIPSKGGLLYAAGLLGHLRSLQHIDIYSLLASSQSSASGGQNRARDPLTLAVILGLSCSFRGTHQGVVFRCLSVHLQSLTPTNADLDVSMEVQIGALYGMGLLCQGSGDSFLVDMLLNEMSRLPSDEHFKNRRGYSLAAGVSLGLILLGKGRSGDNGIEDRLLKILNGAPRDSSRVRSDPVAEFESLMPDKSHFLTRALLHRVSCPVSPPCTKVLEGPQYNVSVSGPGAIMALGLMYIKTNDALMASRLAPPRTVVGTEGVFPEHCHLRSCLAALIMWDNMKPTSEWLFSNVSKRVLNVVKNPEEALAANISSAQVKYLAMNCGHMLAGSVLALGMRYAGSMSALCRNLILGELNGFVSGKIGSTGVLMNQVQKATNAFESCVASCAIALGLVMAGTGDSASLRVLRRILKKPNVTYGTHLSVSMAIGLLFLGGGNLTLSNSVSSVAALMIAFYPCWPRDFNDNADHLQLLRHLYVLAAEGRLLETVDAETNQPLPLQIRVHVSNQQRVQREDDTAHDMSSNASRIWTPLPKDVGGHNSNDVQVVPLTTPCLLPELHTITSIEIRSSEHYPLTLRGNDLVSTIGGTITIRVLPKSLKIRKHQPTSADSIQKYRFSEITDRRCVADQSLKDMARLLLTTKQLEPHIAMITVDNLKLLFQLLDIQSTKLLPPAPVGGTEVVSTTSILSRDLVEQVKRFVAFHYNAILQASDSSAVSLRHPLVVSLIDRVSACDVSSAIAVELADNRGELDLAPFQELQERLFGSSPEQWVAWKADINGISRWVSQALHYYSLAL